MSRRVVTASAGLALVLVLVLSACTADQVDTSSPDLRPVPDGRLIDPATGAATIVFDPDFLRAVGGEVEPLGDATGIGATVTMPIGFGQVSASRTQLTGALVLDGSGARFSGSDAAGGVSDLVLDLDAATAAGSLSTRGRSTARHVLLFDVDLTAAKRPAADPDEAAHLTGARLLLTSDAARRIDDVLGVDRVAAGSTVGVLALSISGGR